jgi:hypothetical protein
LNQVAGLVQWRSDNQNDWDKLKGAS